MESFRKLLFFFLLLNILSDIQAEDGCLSCSKHNIAELGKDIMIKCNTNKPIVVMDMEFCPFKGKCFNKGVIDENTILTYGETTFSFNSNTAFLSIKPIKISHEGNYKLDYVTGECINNLTISLEVFAPYMNLQVMKQEDTLICTASGGYPEKKLYWVSKTGTNMTHKSISQTVKNEDGSFNLSNTLQLESSPSETEFYCVLNHTRVPTAQPVSESMILENVSPSMVKAEKNTTRITTIVLVVISLACILLVVIWWRKRKQDAVNTKWKKLFFRNSLMQTNSFIGTELLSSNSRKNPS